MALAWNAGWVNSPRGFKSRILRARPGCGRVAVASRTTDEGDLWGGVLPGRRTSRRIVGFFYIVFVIPRWWVLTGDVPATAATFGRIVTGFPIAAAAVPVGLTLQRSLKQESRIPALALRLCAWSAVLHVIAGVLIVATAVAEVWLTSQAAAPWPVRCTGVPGLSQSSQPFAFVLSFPAELPPPPPKPARIKPAKQSDKAPKQRRTRKRGRKQSGQGARKGL